MLARLVSDTWHMDPTKPVFIDRNGSTFDLVLDYLPYGSITLPITVSMKIFLRDMDFYGIVHDEGTVKTSPEAWAVQVSNRRNRKKLKEERTHLELVNDIDLLANDCAGQYLLGNDRVQVSYYPETNGPDKATEEKLVNAARSQSQEKYGEIFQCSFSKWDYFWLRTPRNITPNLLVLL